MPATQISKMRATPSTVEEILIHLLTAVQNLFSKGLSVDEVTAHFFPTGKTQRDSNFDLEKEFEI